MRLALYKSRSQNSTEPVEQNGLGNVVVMLLLHVGLALLFREVRFFSTMHAILILALGLYKALTTEDLAEVVPYAAYIMGAEVFWRMTKAGIFWEFGKYAIIFIFMVALIRQKKPLNNFFWPALSFLLFLPSVYLTFDALGFTNNFRDSLSFNMSGPLAVFICVLFFSQVTLNQKALKKTIWTAVYPITGILTLAVRSTLTATSIEFGSESVFATSGGFGPNQVSAMLGLGALLLILYTIQDNKFKGRTIALILALLLIVQSFLTFSRGGLINLVVALGAAFIFLLRRPGKIVRPLFVLFIILITVGYVIFPRLEAFTSGALSARFTDLDPTGRIKMAQSDIDLFLANPFVGVGPGMSSMLRSVMGGVAAHTEYSRILAEHGILGALGLLIIVVMLMRSLFKTPSAMAQAWLVASAAWAAVEMGHAAMRIVAIPFMLGFAFVAFDLKDFGPPQQDRSSTLLYRFHRYQKRTDA